MPVDSFDNAYYENAYGNYAITKLPYDEYAASLDAVIDDNATILVVGAAYGHLIHKLRGLGYSAYGMDISEHAVEMSQQLYEDDYVTLGDARVREDYDAVLNIAGVGQFDVGHTAAVLECLSDDDARVLCENLRSVSDISIHRVWTEEDEWPKPDGYNVQSLEAWKEKCDPKSKDLWYRNADFSGN